MIDGAPPQIAILQREVSGRIQVTIATTTARDVYAARERAGRGRLIGDHIAPEIRGVIKFSAYPEETYRADGTSAKFA